MGYLFHRKWRYRITAVTLVIVMAAVTAAACIQEGMQAQYVALSAAAMAAVVFMIMLMPVSAPPGRTRSAATVFQTVFNTIVAIVSPLAAVLLLQNFTLDPFRIYPLMLLANAVFYYLFYLLLVFATGSFAAGYIIADFVFLVLGVANYFVVQFRGSPIVPWDLFSIRTAASVANNYTYEIHWRFAASAFGFFILAALHTRLLFKLRSGFVRIAGAAVCAGGLVFATLQLQSSEVKDKLGMDVTLFTPNVRYRNNGFLAAFLGNLHLINVQEPDGYSVSRTRSIADDVLARHQQENASQTREAAGAKLEEGRLPNIIVIMDEAFSELQVLGSFETNQDYMPNFRRLLKEYNGGNLLVSVRGGNTANTEFEFLSGDTMAFLPSGSVVYQQFIRDNIPVLPSYLASLGYSTLAIHPYLGSGWDRQKVYPLLGFQDFLTQDDFEAPEKMRLYISDESAFEKIIEEFEKKKGTGEPQFIFEVTMQNHSGYSKEYPGFSEEIFLTGLTYSNIQTRAAEKYLTLIYESDKALGNLMNYFETVDEPTVIVMFGDHQPSDYVTSVIERLVGYDPEISLEEAQKAYMVPYFIWNNFGMQMENRDLISVNYMAADLLQAAGIPLTAYQEFLLDLQKELPVVSGGAWVDAAGVWHSHDEQDMEERPGELLNAYNVLQYNHVTDIRNRITDIFAQPAGEPLETSAAETQ